MPFQDALIQQAPGLLVGAATVGFAFLVRRRIERRREVDALDIEKRTAELHVLMKEKNLTFDDLAALRATLTGGVRSLAGPVSDGELHTPEAPVSARLLRLISDAYAREHFFPRWWSWMQGFFAVYWTLSLIAAAVENDPLTARSAVWLVLQGGLLLLATRDLALSLGHTELVLRVVRKRLFRQRSGAGLG